MKKIFLGAGILFSAYLLQAQQVKVTNTTAQAQEQAEVTRKPVQSRNHKEKMDHKLTPDQRATKQVERVDAAVQLSPEQKVKLHDIYVKQNVEKAEARERYVQSKAAVDAVLTPDQKVKLEEVQAKKVAERKATQSKVQRGPTKVAPSKQVDQ